MNTDMLKHATLDERASLDQALDDSRAHLIQAMQGITEPEARFQLVPSLTTPIALLKHCAAAERIWFQRTLARMPLGQCDGVATGGDVSFIVPPTDTLKEVSDEYSRACSKSRKIAAEFSLDDIVGHHIFGRINVRFVYLTMLAEISRHAGHADILVEQIIDRRK
jgi:Protein of unknown function (DUF664)